jgi:hypothetical protein
MHYSSVKCHQKKVSFHLCFVTQRWPKMHLVSSETYHYCDKRPGFFWSLMRVESRSAYPTNCTDYH